MQFCQARIVFAVLFLMMVGCQTKTTPHILSSDGVQVAFVVKGVGETAIVFVHGWGGNRTIWNIQQEHFASKYKVVTIDLPGFGQSGSNRKIWTIPQFGDDVLSVIRALDLRQVILVGHSMGADVVVEAAKQLASRLVIVVPVDMFQNIESVRTTSEIEQFIEGAMAMAENPSIEQFRSMFVRNISDSTLKEIVDGYRDSPKNGWRKSLEAHFDWANDNMIGSLQSVPCPIHCINSDRRPTDMVIAKKHLAMFDASIINGVGHAIMIEAPDEFSATLEKIIQKALQNRQQ